MQKFSIASNGLSDGERQCKADHENSSSTAPENNVLETSTHAKEYEKTWSGFWRSKKTALLSRDSSRSDSLTAAGNEIMFSKPHPDLK